MAWTSEARLRWVSTTPLGAEVVPEVKTRLAIVSPVIVGQAFGGSSVSAAGTRSASPAFSSVSITSQLARAGMSPHSSRRSSSYAEETKIAAEADSASTEAHSCGFCRLSSGSNGSNTKLSSNNK